MSSVKKYLKSAKAALESNDPVLALEHAADALEEDEACYFAHVFQGKSYQLLRDIPKAIAAFQKATEIEPDNLLAWKGYFQVVRTTDDYKLFFKVLTSVIRIQIDQGQPIGETLRDMRNYLDLQKYKTNDKLYEFYLQSILPGTELGDLVGTAIEPTDVTVKKLLDSKFTTTEKAATARVSKERVKFGRAMTVDQKAKLDSIAWSYYEDGAITKLFDLFFNVCDDDGLRRKYEEKYLKFKYELLKICPDKQTMYQDIKQQMDDMILVNTQSLFCWNLYFDWCDAKTINDLDEDKIIAYLQIFQNEGLGLILFAFVMSDISPYNKERIVKGLSANELTKGKETSEKIDIEDDEDAKVLEDLADVEQQEENVAQYYLPQSEVLGLILDGYSKAKNSILAGRIIVNYYIYLRQYSEASEKCREGIRALADLQRTFGIDLANTKEDFLCSLAIVYTYYEAPKNYNRAIQLYEKILESDPKNDKAQVGKGLIYAERGELQEARNILEAVVKEYPDNMEAESEYFWCLIRLGEHAKGREGLTKFLAKVTGGDLQSRETRAVAYWRLAKSYIMEDDSNKDNIKECYSNLILSLKDSDVYAPSYTLLGILFQDYYGDVDRAQKCFYRAFDLDINEIVAARYLVEQATAKNEWEVAQVLAKRVVSNESSRRLVMREDVKGDKSWPYRVLGCGALNVQDDAKAVEWFQNALRLDAHDFECWVGLGEAYYNCGRYDAAAKVFNHALTIKSDVWTVKYMLGVVTCEMKEYNEGLTYLYEALESKPDEECIISAIYEANIENTHRFVQSGFFGRAINADLKAISFIKQSLAVNASSQKAWKSLSEGLKVFTKIQVHIDELPFDEVLDIFKQAGLEETTTVGDITLDQSISLQNAEELYTRGDKVSALLLLVILAAVASIKFLPAKANKLLRATAYYNLGLSLLEAFQIQHTDSFRDSSVLFFKRAIQLESNNANYWIALGNAYFSSNPQIAQHCYIKATTLEVKDAEIWVNLASLFLRYGDTELSQETFLRAQSVAPQDAQSWLGNAVAADILGDESRASGYYTHAFTLSKGRLALAQFLYGLSVINKSKDRDPRDIETAQEFSISNQAMQQYLKYDPEDEAGLVIALSIAERCKDFELAIKLGVKLSELYEKQYEESEGEAILQRFALVKSQLARIYLGLGEYEQALDNAQMALQLDETPEIVLSAKTTMGLSYFFTNDFSSALGELKVVLAQHNESSRIVSLIAQVLYAEGTDETKQAAVDQLFAHIEEHGSSLLVVLTLGAISLVDDLDDYLPAIKDELASLGLNDIVSDTYREVPRLLDAINARLGDEEDGNVWLRYAYLFPFDYNIWKNVNNSMAKQVISLHDVKVNGLQYSDALLKNGQLRDIQRSLLLNPGNPEALEALDMCF
ncbi:Superkiller protein 3 [Candida viswanathii]|uniref:Superkiller protein 3 n=1 Tax=Candida viswanathii TaxID=5486 RepID=A0A367YAY4_9ASCO|nr:Superkiller protein 3 [Candida viswanathii]